MRDVKPVQRIVVRLFLALVAASFATAAAAQSLQRIKQRGAVTIGYRDDASPFSLADKSGKPVGYAIEICQFIASKLTVQAGLANQTVRYLAVPVDQVERFLKSANVDLFCSATSDTPERRKSMDFSPPIYVAATMVLVRKKDGYASVTNLGGKSVAVIDKTTAVKALEVYANAKGLAISAAKAVGADAALGQLRMGWVAGYVRDDVLLVTQLATVADADTYTVLPEPLSTEKIAIAMPMGDATFQKLVAQALAEAYTSGLIDASYERWFTKPIPPNQHALNLPMSADLKAAFGKLK